MLQGDIIERSGEHVRLKGHKKKKSRSKEARQKVQLNNSNLNKFYY
jgi:hypothetical protein